MQMNLLEELSGVLFCEEIDKEDSKDPPHPGYEDLMHKRSSEITKNHNCDQDVFNQFSVHVVHTGNEDLD